MSYTANNLDQYTAIGSVTPTYDGNGNLAFDGTFTYGYDAENRLISASGAGNTAAYAYDAQGRRKSKTVNGAATIFVQDPQGRALLDYDGASGAIQNWYAFGSGPNDALNQINVAGSTRATTIPDIQGSIIARLDASSGTLTKAGYQSYGESSVTSGTFRYTGARIDAETNGLYDLRARMYSPALGRFMQVDPTGAKGGINLYAYVGNDPLNKVDPSGTDPIIGATVGLFIGGFYGGLSAYYSPGSSLTSVLVGAAAGGVVGAGVGLFDPTLGAGTFAVVGGLAGAAGDLASQFVTNAQTGKPINEVNFGSTLGAAAGGAISAAGGNVLGSLASKVVTSEIVATTLGASISAGPAAVLPQVGAALSDSLNSPPPK